MTPIANTYLSNTTNKASELRNGKVEYSSALIRTPQNSTQSTSQPRKSSKSNHSSIFMPASFTKKSIPLSKSKQTLKAAEISSNSDFDLKAYLYEKRKLPEVSETNISQSRYVEQVQTPKKIPDSGYFCNSTLDNYNYDHSSDLLLSSKLENAFVDCSFEGELVETNAIPSWDTTIDSDLETFDLNPVFSNILNVDCEDPGFSFLNCGIDFDLVLETVDKDSVCKPKSSSKTPVLMDDKVDFQWFLNVDRTDIPTKDPIMEIPTKNIMHIPLAKAKKQRTFRSNEIVSTPKYGDYNYDNKKYECETEQVFKGNHACISIPPERERKINQLVYKGAHNVKVPTSSIVRQRYVRNISQFIELGQPNEARGIKFKYFLNYNFNGTNPYAYQIFRVQVDSQGVPINSSSHGLCPYCPQVRFCKIKNSAYGQHLMLHHGIRTNNYLVPNPVLPNVYFLKKGKDEVRELYNSHGHAKAGVVCPCCFEVLEVACSSITKDVVPLTSYLRHFRDFHTKKDSCFSEERFL